MSSIGVALELPPVFWGEDHVHLPKRAVFRAVHDVEQVQAAEAAFFQETAHFAKAQTALGQLEVVDLDHDQVGLLQGLSRPLKDRHFESVRVKLQQKGWPKLAPSD